MAGIKLVPQFADSHGVLHPTVDQAVIAERRIMVSDMVVMRHHELGLSFAQIDPTVDVLTATYVDMEKIMGVDLKRGLHNGGLVSGGTGTRVGERTGETVMTRAVPPAKRTKDADGRIVFVGDRVHMIGTEPDSRAKWGPEPTRTVGDIREDGTMSFVGDKEWVWHPSAVRKGEAPKAAA